MLWVVGLGVVAALLLLSWFNFIAPTRRLVRYLRADDTGIQIGKAEIIPWARLREVVVETTAAGPWAEDFYLILWVDGRRRPVKIPDPLIPLVLTSVQQLPNFDNNALIRATGSIERARFSCWTRNTPSA